MSKSEIKTQLISTSLEDIDQINYSPHISIELFNYALSLCLFSLKYSSPLWKLNKFYALIFSVHLGLIGILSLVSFSSFEVLYKFQSCFANGIKLTLNLSQTR